MLSPGTTAEIMVYRNIKQIMTFANQISSNTARTQRSLKKPECGCAVFAEVHPFVPPPSAEAAGI